MSNCDGRLKNCGAVTVHEYHDGECEQCSDDVLKLPTIWHDDKLWVKVPGYKTFYTCVATGEQKIIKAIEGL